MSYICRLEYAAAPTGNGGIPIGQGALAAIGTAPVAMALYRWVPYNVNTPTSILLRLITYCKSRYF